MILDKDCVRDTLFYIEQHCVYYDDKRLGRRLHEVSIKELSESDELSTYDYDTIHYTLEKLFEGNYIQGYFIPNNAPHTFKIAYVEALSLTGHALLDNIKPQSIWDKTKEKMQKIGSFSLDIMSQIAGEAMAAHIYKSCI